MSESDKILVFGGAGNLGVAMAAYFPQVALLSREECDVTDRAAVLAAIASYQPTVVVNAAAITSPVLCEQEPHVAWDVNVYGARNVAWAARKSAVYSVQMSSNWAIDPANEYGRTKLVSESIGADLTVRVCYYSETYWVFDHLAQGRQVRLLDSDSYNPISAFGLLRALEFFIGRRRDGLVQVGTRDRISHFDFGMEACRVMGFSPALLVPATTVSVAYEYPINTFLAPTSRLLTPALGIDLMEFRNSMLWKYGAEADAGNESVGVEANHEMPRVHR